MKMQKKPLLIVLLLLFSILVMLTAVCSVSAESSKVSETESPEEIHYEMVEVNPLYADQISEKDLITPDENQPIAISSDEVYTTVEDAGEELRYQMKDRIETVAIQYEMSTEYSYESIMSDIGECALKHTGVPTEGDYLRYQFAGWKAGLSGYVSGGKYHFTFTYTITYYTDAAQEKVVDTKISQVMEALNLKDCSDYQKIKKIYDYICAHVTYDYKNLEDDSYTLKYTGYAALINGTSVCQGYAVLLYRMLLETGIDNRIIAGTGNGGNHGWNIVKLGDVYYYADSTWDAGRTEYLYFLKNEEDFVNHTRGTFGSINYTSEEFNQQYPMSAVSYSTEADTGCTAGHTWSTEYTVDQEATCTEAGSQSIHCTKCDATKDAVAIPATGHSYTYTDNKDNSHTATCVKGDLTVTQAHTYINGVCRACSATVDTNYTVQWYINGTVAGTKTVKKGNICSVKATKVDGKLFSHWSSKADGSNKLSTSETYTFYVSKNIEIYAIYTTEAVKIEPIVSLSNTYAFISGSKNYVRFEATRSVPVGYKIVEHGIIYGNSTTVFGKGDEDSLMRFTDTDHTTLPNKVKKLVVSGTARNGMDYLNVSVGNSKDVVVYARGYVIVRNTDTQEITVLYSDVSSGSFNGLNGLK